MIKLLLFLPELRKLVLWGGVVAHVVLLSARATLLDATFNPILGTNVLITAIAHQPDGRIVVAEAFLASDSSPRSTRIARLHMDGSADASFHPGTGPDDDVNAIVVQPDGRIVIAGYFNFFDGVSRSGIARLNADGSLDPSFDPGTGVEKSYTHPQGHAAALHADGRIVIGGYFKTVNGVPRDGIAQLNADGTVDLSFDPGTGLESFVALTAAALTNGQVLVGGIFERINGVPRKSIARLNVDGSVDQSFAVPNGGIGGSNALERVYALAAQPDGRVIIAGDFTLVGNTRRQHVARLNADGSLDQSFDPGYIYLQRVSALALQPDGRLVIAGDFRSIDGVSRNCVARLMSDGSLDLGFDPGTGAQVPPFSSSDAFVHALALQPEGRIIVAGLFATFDGVARHSLARLHHGTDTNLVIFNFAPYPINRAVQEDAGAAIVTINRIGSHDGVVSVDYATRDGTAQAGADYTAQSGTITFGIGERTKTISIPILEDTPPENDEQFQVALANPSPGAVIGSLGTLDVTIAEEDSGVEFSAAIYKTNEVAANVKITVKRVGKIGFGGRATTTFTVDFATADGTATAGQDYVAQSGTLRFGYFLNDWERQKTFNIPILDDTLGEGDETILLSLSNPSDGIVLGERSTTTVVIVDNDSVAFNPPQLMPKGEIHLTSKNHLGMGQVLEASSNLRDWLPIYTNAAPGNLLDFIDADASKYQRRFYRAVTP
jgi:uncharacterized delta-60 repeat protein